MNLLHILAQNKDATFFLPKQGSNLAVDVDFAWNVVLGVCTLFFVIVVGAMTLFVIKYRRRHPNAKTSEITHNTPLEIAWTTIPLILVVIFFFIGFKGFLNYDNPPSDCVIVDVQAHKWAFQFTYPNGAVSDQLYVKLNQPVRLNMTSVDVLHALYIPAFRTQRNLIPGRITTIWFTPTAMADAPDGHDDPGESIGEKTRIGGYPVFCTQYCGDGHSTMHTHAYVLEDAEYAIKMTELANPFSKKVNGKNVYVPYKDVGEKLTQQMGCLSCHSTTGGPSGTSDEGKLGPPWKGLWKRTEKFSASNNIPPSLATEIAASEPDAVWQAYIEESIISPAVKIVAGRTNAMPGSFGSMLTGSESNNEKLRAIVEYIKSLGSLPYVPAADPVKDADLFNADKYPSHPESLKGIAARTQPAPAGPGQ